MLARQPPKVIANKAVVIAKSNFFMILYPNSLDEIHAVSNN